MLAESGSVGWMSKLDVQEMRVAEDCAGVCLYFSNNIHM